ncbi:multidrug resistance protein, MATE family [Streptomyces sp. TLI_053]|uniref:MATE family efflux transporter n=1 Tax=Streptomyces sp. TLI_053 TaxID=1855352 RepID=UPI000879B8CA|nr:MATE family efflux transporter [Streptomyces sp. TLI_053]SDT82990.1 multidrug resistance protein, MATE family [Streptomyces sp. TLI_053]
MKQTAVLARDSRALAALAVPLALTQLAQVALTTTDTVMMGVLGTEALAAGGLALVVFNQLRTMGVGLVTSVGNQVAAAAARAERGERTGPAAPTGPAAAGADDGHEVRALVRAAMAVATLAGIAGAVLMVLVGQAATWLGQDAAVAERAQSMLAALAPGLLPCLWFQAVRQFTVGMRRPQALLRITVAAVAVNAGLDWVFIHGTWGLPELGLTGVGVATSSVHLLSFLALRSSARRDPGLAPLLTLDFWRADAATVRRLLRLGTPIAATYGSEAGFFSVTALLAGSFGAAALAAHTAVNQLIYIVFQVAVGLSHAASINVSRELALGDRAAARRIKNTALACGAAVSTLVGIVYLTAPRLVLRPFFDPGTAADQQGLRIATGLLAVVAVLQFFDCAQNIGVGLLRGLDDTGSGFRITLIGYWAVGLPAAWLLAYPLGGETRGLWLGLLVGLATTAVLLLRRYTRALDAGAAVATAATPAPDPSPAPAEPERTTPVP